MICAGCCFAASETTFLSAKEIGRAHVNSSHSQISYAVFCLKKKKRMRATFLHIQRDPHYGYHRSPEPPHLGDDIPRPPRRLLRPPERCPHCPRYNGSLRRQP